MEIDILCTYVHCHESYVRSSLKNSIHNKLYINLNMLIVAFFHSLKILGAHANVKLGKN